MSERPTPVLKVAANDAAPDNPGLSFGPKLKAGREALGLSVNDMAARLRLHPKQVIALERENLQALPGAAFVRGFVRNYAKEVRLDVAALVADVNRVLEPPVAAATTGEGASPIMGTAEQSRWSRPLVITGAIAALVLFAVLGWVSTSRTRTAASVTPAPMANAPVPSAPAATPAAVASSTALPSVSPGTATEAPATSSATPAAQPAGGEAPPSGAPATPAQEPYLLRLNFRETSWVEVVQGDGTVLLSQNNEAGTEQVLRGKPPYRVVIGNAAGVGVEYEGKSIDLRPLTTGGNVARLTLPEPVR